MNDHDDILRYFTFTHLPDKLAQVSRPFYDLATAIAGRRSADNAETAVALRKLLEAKDAAVRAAL